MKSPEKKFYSYWPAAGDKFCTFQGAQRQFGKEFDHWPPIFGRSWGKFFL